MKHTEKKKPIKFKSLCLALLSVLAIGTANAGNLSGIVGIGIDSGGEKLGSAFFADGEKENIHANAGFSLLGGIALPLLNGLELQSTLGFTIDSADAENGDMTWTSIPWETTLMAKLGSLNIGGGTVYHLSPEFSTSGFLANLGDFKFDDTLGYQAQVGWSPSSNHRVNVGLRYTAVEFERADIKINGDSTGLFLKYQF